MPDAVQYTAPEFTNVDEATGVPNSWLALGVVVAYLYRAAHEYGCPSTQTTVADAANVTMSRFEHGTMQSVKR